MAISKKLYLNFIFILFLISFTGCSTTPVEKNGVENSVYTLGQDAIVCQIKTSYISNYITSLGREYICGGNDKYDLNQGTRIMLPSSRDEFYQRSAQLGSWQYEQGNFGSQETRFLLLTAGTRLRFTEYNNRLAYSMGFADRGQNQWLLTVISGPHAGTTVSVMSGYIDYQPGGKLITIRPSSLRN